MSQWKCQKWQAFWPTLDIINLSKPLKCYTWRWSTHWYLTYCNITWASTYPTRLNSVLKTQKKSYQNYDFFKIHRKIRTTVQVPENTKHLRVKCISNSRFLMYSHHHEKLPAFLDNLFKTNKSVHSCNTRSAANIHKKSKLWQIFRLLFLRKPLYGTTFPQI